MRVKSKIESSEYTDLNRVIRWFIMLRWVAVAGVYLALAIGRFVYRYDLSFTTLYALSGALALVNLSYTIYFCKKKSRSLSRDEMTVFFHIQIVSDYTFLFLLVYVAGFLENPFAYYFVFHIMLTSFIFPARTVRTYVGGVVAVIAVAALLESNGLIPHNGIGSSNESADFRDLQLVRTLALCSTLLITAYLITSIKGRIEERGQRMELELDRYRSLDKAKSNFILQVTHELRGPVAALKGYHEMIMKGITGSIPDKTRRTILRANHRTTNLLNIIDEMIDFAYMKSEEDLTPETSSIDVVSNVKYNVDLYSTAARQKDIKLVTSVTKGLQVFGSRDLINIILGNLITNAIRYSESGTTVTIHATSEGANVHLLVNDEGMGIEPEELENVFEDFYRTRRAREIERDGTGLGLSIVQKAVNLMNGRIIVYSELRKGTTFHIYLPKGEAEE